MFSKKEWVNNFIVTGGLTAILWLGSAMALFAQDNGAEVLFLNGKRLLVQDVNDSTYIPIQYNFDKNYFKKERINLKEARKLGVLYTSDFTSPRANEIPVVLTSGYADRDDVFSITYPTGKEILYYVYDEPRGNILEQEEMRAYVYGLRDARVALTGKGWFYSGLLVGGIAGYGLKTSVFTLAVPPIFALSAKIPVIHIKERYIADKKYQYNPHYALGFEKHARSRNAIEALKGSAIGAVVGIVAYAIIDNQR